MLKCALCDYTTKESLQTHIRTIHGIKNKEYMLKYPESPIYSESYKNKISNSVKHLWTDKRYRDNFSVKFKKSLTVESIKKRSESVKRFYKNITEEQRNKHKEALKKRWEDPVKKQKWSEALKKAGKTDTSKKNRSDAQKEYRKNLTETQKEEIKNNLKKVWAQPILRSKILEIAKNASIAAKSPQAIINRDNANKKPEVKEKRRNAAIRRLINQPKISSLNRRIIDALNIEGIYPSTEVNIGPYVVDLCFKDKGIVVEIDGDYWHANPATYSDDKLNKIQLKTRYKDKAEKAYLENRGWILLRLWEKDINLDITKCIYKIKDTINL